VAGHAAAPVATELAEEEIASIDEAVGADGDNDAAVVAGAVQLWLDGAVPIVVVGAGESRQAARHEQHRRAACAYPLLRHMSSLGAGIRVIRIHQAETRR